MFAHPSFSAAGLNENDYVHSCRANAKTAISPAAIVIVHAKVAINSTDILYTNGYMPGSSLYDQTAMRMAVGPSANVAIPCGGLYIPGCSLNVKMAT